MFVVTGPQEATDKGRKRKVMSTNHYELAYKRDKRTVTLDRRGYLDCDFKESFIPSGTTLQVARHPAWDESKTPLTEDEHLEMIEDLKEAFRVMGERLTLEYGELPHEIFYEAEPKRYRK